MLHKLLYVYLLTTKDLVYISLAKRFKPAESHDPIGLYICGVRSLVLRPTEVHQATRGGISISVGPL